jgi:hypothetical protein
MMERSCRRRESKDCVCVALSPFGRRRIRWSSVCVSSDTGLSSSGPFFIKTKKFDSQNTWLVSIKMLSNKVRNDSWWLLKCFDYLAGPLQMADLNRNNFLDFRRVIEERMAEYAREIEGLELKLEKEKSHRVSLEITEKPVQAAVAPVQPATNQFVEVLEPIQHWPSVLQMQPSAKTPVPTPSVSPAPTRVAVVKEQTPVPTPLPVKTKVALPPVEPQPEEAEEEEEPAPEEAEEEEEEAEEEEAEEEAEDEPEPEENYEQIRIKKTNYWLETNSRKVYQITADGEVGDLVANYKLVNGVATLAPL